MYTRRSIQDQIAEYEFLAREQGITTRPLFLVFEDGDEIEAGRVLQSAGRLVYIGGVACIPLWVPVDEWKGRILSPAALSNDGKHVLVAQSADGCAPVNPAAVEMCRPLREKAAAKS